MTHTAPELSHIRKQGEESACLAAFNRLSCSPPIIILNKQKICLLSISPCSFLHLNFPPRLPSLRTASSRVAIVASTAPATPREAQNTPTPLPSTSFSRHLHPLAVPPGDTPVTDGHFCACSPWLQSLQKLQSSDRILAQEAVFSWFSFAGSRP